MSEGLKFDEGKQKWHSLPLEILEPLADLFEAGCKKYGKFNCLNMFINSDERFWNSRLRHMVKCQFNPLAVDEETGCYHEAAIAFASLMRLYHARKPPQIQDDESLEQMYMDNYNESIRELKKAMLAQIVAELESELDGKEVTTHTTEQSDRST